MDFRVIAACKKAINLCTYMLRKKPDEFVHDERIRIHELMVENNDEKSASHEAREVSKYIKKNFDTAVGENVEIDIDYLLSSLEKDKSN